VSKFFGFLLGIAVALVGPAMFGVLAAKGGIELNGKEMALAYGVGALIFWVVVSYFSGAGALGAALAFGTLIYAVYWIPNRMTNFLNDIPGVTNGMIDGIKQYTQNGMVPVLAVISLIYAIQLIVQSVQKRRRLRAEADRLQREQELAQAQQEAEVTAQYPVAGPDYPTTVDYRYGSQYPITVDNRYGSQYEEPYGEDPVPFPPSSYSSLDDERTTQFAGADAANYAPAEDQTTQLPIDEQGNDQPDEAATAEHPTEPEPQPQAHPQPQADTWNQKQPDEEKFAADKTGQFGQQYRERMDGPHLEEAAEHQFGAFENPMENARPQFPLIMDFPRPATA
jgi:heme exporter protein D